ncbi:hypothetical protein G6M40_02280 [Agrobacterium tumefaciens]|uniref:Uncharacterized protein n=2 Tax=Rhizobiaceae TaxID=82115 RepID=A0AA44JAI2_AGRTU|nr:hypothetical protein [Agrobacterium tumefaciens]NTB86106.1 hypothetical protein [Agrobacterium tumefaciens]NTC18214.1 hypothetical protein [Agrobacterium tumefaciens]NTC29983.1 hypothetical protein [Agrobacterium tumefaciens]NTC53646.1 hypothetical protein [Agrobacterium tumefaciens]
MSVSIKNSSQLTTASSASSRSKVQTAPATSIRSVFASGQSSVRASTTNATPKMSSIEYLASSGFMRNLKVKLSTAGDDPAQYLRSQSMMSALAGGRLQISDPTQGKSISAWDPSQKNARSTTATDIAKTNWADFLNSQLKRNESGVLSKDASGSYVDKTTGNHAYFGRVAGKYYYVTWPAETKT